MDRIRRNNYGFSFIEIISVLFILSCMLSASLVVSQRTLKEQTERIAVFTMYSEICSLRNEGIMTLKQTRVRFYQNYNNSGQSAYQLQMMENNIWKTKKRVVLDKNLKIFSITFPGNSTNQNFTFYGTPLYSGSIGVKNEENQIFYLVFYHSGRIRIKEGA